MDYKAKIIEMVQKMKNQDYLMRIYSFVKVKYERENIKKEGERD